MRRFRPHALTAQSLYGLVGSAASRGASLALTVAIARLLDTKSLGIYVVCAVIGALVSIAADGGLVPASLAWAQGDPVLASQLRRDCLPIRCIYLLVSVVCGVGACLVLVPPSSRLTGSLIVIGFGLQSTASYARFPLLAAGQLQREINLTTVERLLTAALGIAAIAMTDRLLAVAVVHVVIPAVTCVYAGWRIRFPRAAVPRPTSMKELVKVGARLGGVSFVSQTYSRLDAVVLAMAVSATSLGIYAAAYSLLTAAVLIPTVLYTIALANALHPESAAAEAFYRRNVWVSSVVGAIALTLVGPVATSRLFDVDYTAQLHALFLCLGPAFFFMGQNSRLNLLAVKYGTSGWLLKVTLGGLVVNAVSCLLLINAFGILGAAMATLTTEAGIYLTARWRYPTKVTSHAAI